MAFGGGKVPGQLFVGSSKQINRKLLKGLLGKLSRSHDVFVEPCSGPLTISALASQAGFNPERMESSDITLYSSVLGYAVAGQPIADLQIRIDGREYEDAAEIILEQERIFCERLGNAYWMAVSRELDVERKTHLERLNEQIGGLRKLLGGMEYRCQDMFAHMAEHVDNERAVVVVNAPILHKDYERFYDTEGRVEWAAPEYEIFNPQEGGYDRIQAMFDGVPALMVAYMERDDAPEHGIVAVRGGVRKSPGDGLATRSCNGYFVSNRADEVRGILGGAAVSDFEGMKLEPGNFRLTDEQFVPTAESEVELRKIEGAQAYYYRKLWTHGFVGVGCNVNVGVFVDGRLIGIFGLDKGYISMGRGTSPRVLILYSMQVALRKKPIRWNRLLTMMAKSE